MSFLNPTYGRDLAERVALLLDRGGQIADCHAYYCGTGFVLENGRYCWAHIDDGYPGEELKSFESRDEFVNWLSEQSDESLRHWQGQSSKLQIPGLQRMHRDTRGLAQPRPRRS